MHVDIDIWDSDDTDALLMVKMQHVQIAVDSIIEKIGITFDGDQMRITEAIIWIIE